MVIGVENDMSNNSMTIRFMIRVIIHYIKV